MKQIFFFVTAMLAMIMVCHSQANRQLSNLTSPTAVNVNLLPGGATGTKDFGSNTKRWNNGYFNGTVYCYGGASSYGVYTAGGSSGVLASGSSYGLYGTSSYCGVSGYGNTYGLYASGGTWAGYFVGNVYSTGGYSGSDKKLKQNIRDFSSALDIINKLKPKQYEFRQDGNYKFMKLPQGSHFGLIAQDVEKVLPNLVRDTKFETGTAQPQMNKTALQTPEAVDTGTRSETINFKALNYTELIPVLIKGMQELDQKNNKLEQENIQLQSEVEELKQMVNQSIKLPSAAYRSKFTLGQNYPNPFTTSTVISFTIPTQSKSASVVITQTGQGKIIKILPVSTGASQLTFDAASLSSGAYTYTLYLNGKKVDAKQMVIIR